MAGRLAGIARHDRPRGPIETLESVHVSVDGGLAGDFRGAVKPGGKRKRQVSLIEAGDWASAMADLRADLDWSVRRANLLVEGLDLPQMPGAVIAIGKDVRLEITVECDPCSRMEEIAPGLKAVLTPDWRGGALARVLSGGDIAVGDEIRIEE
jgi:MOSC domain-containing protein YiiM